MNHLRPVEGAAVVRVARVAMALAPVVLAGCIDAPDQVQGGEPLFDAAAATTSTPVDYAEAGPHTYTDLYDSFFGPNGAASCTANSSCHGAKFDLGEQGSGYVCGTSEATCFAGMMTSTSPMFPILVPAGGSSNPTRTVLYEALSERDSPLSGGAMPLTAADGGPGYQFTPDDLTRIAAWIAQGAQDN